MSLIFDLELSILTGFTHTYPLCEVSMVLEYVFQECSVWSSYSIIFIGAVEILSASWSHHYQNWFIYTWVWKLFISQHQALAEAVASLGQSYVGLNYYLLNDTHELHFSEQRKLQVTLVALGGSCFFVDVMCWVLLLTYFSLDFSFLDFDVTFL